MEKAKVRDKRRKIEEEKMKCDLGDTRRVGRRKWNNANQWEKYLQLLLGKDRKT